MGAYRSELVSRQGQVTQPEDIEAAALGAFRHRLTEAYQVHYTGLLLSAQSLMGCRSRAEDVVQDAFLKLWEGGTHQSVRDDGKYLFRVVRNQAIDRLRRLALEQRYGADVALMEQEPAPPSSSPEQRLIGREALQHLMAALGELTPRMRRVLFLSRLEGWTQRDIARSIGASPTLVNFLLRDTLVHCRRCLGPAGAGLLADSTI